MNHYRFEPQCSQLRDNTVELHRGGKSAPTPFPCNETSTAGRAGIITGMDLACYAEDYLSLPYG